MDYSTNIRKGPYDVPREQMCDPKIFNVSYCIDYNKKNCPKTCKYAKEKGLLKKLK